MALLTAADIATALEAVSYVQTPKAINAYVVQDVSRREYPSIDVENITGQEQLVDVPTTNNKQIYLVHLYYRVTGFGNLDEPAVKTFEDEIFEKIDSLQDTNTKISITESWQRKHSVDGTPHIQSTLRVTTDEISSTSGDGVLGNEVTITFPFSGVIKTITLVTPGAGFVLGETVSIVGDSSTAANAVGIVSEVTTTGLTGLTLTGGGTGYTLSEAVTISSTSATTDSAGTISALETGIFDVINLITDSLSAEKDRDLTTSEEIFTLIHATGLLDLEIELDISQESSIDTFLKAGADISITLTKGGVGISKTANLISKVSSATRTAVQTTIISMDIKS